MRNCFWILVAAVVCSMPCYAAGAEYFNPDGSISRSPVGNAHSASVAENAIDALYPESVASGSSETPEPMYPPGIEPPKPLSVDPTMVGAQPEAADMPAIPEDAVGSNPALRSHTNILPSASATENRAQIAQQMSASSGLLYEGKMVADVKIVGNKLNTFEKILPYLKTRPGRPFNKKILEDDVRRLLRSRLFTMATPYFKETPDGLEVVFQVSERPVIQYIRYVGCNKIKKGALAKECSLKIGGAMDPSEVESNRERLESYYKEKGYAHASVNVVQGLQLGDPGVIFQINEGPKQKIHWVDFEGNNIASDARLRTQIQTKHGFLWILGGDLDYNKIDADMKTLEEYYKNLGFLDVHIGREVRFNEPEEWARITFYINEGPRYKIRNMTIAGNTQYETEELQQAMKIKSGDYFSKPLLRAGISRIQSKYGKIGHVFADVKPDVRYLETPGECDLILAVKEGESYRVGRVNVLIAGDFPHTQIDTVLNRMSVRPGDIMDTTKIKASERRLKASQLFANDPAKGVTPSIVYSPPEIKDLEKKDGEQMARPDQRPGAGSSFRGQSGAKPESPATEGGYRHVVQFAPQNPSADNRPTLDLTFVGVWAPNGQTPQEPPVWRNHLSDDDPIDDPQADQEDIFCDGPFDGQIDAGNDDFQSELQTSAQIKPSNKPAVSEPYLRSGSSVPSANDPYLRVQPTVPPNNRSDNYYNYNPVPVPSGDKRNFERTAWRLTQLAGQTDAGQTDPASVKAVQPENRSSRVVFRGQSFGASGLQQFEPSTGLSNDFAPADSSSNDSYQAELSWQALQNRVNRAAEESDRNASAKSAEQASSESDVSATVYDPSAFNRNSGNTARIVQTSASAKQTLRGQNVLVDPFGKPQTTTTNKTRQQLYAPDAISTTNSDVNNSFRQSMYTDNNNAADNNTSPANYSPATTDRAVVPSQPWQTPQTGASNTGYTQTGYTNTGYDNAYSNADNAYGTAATGSAGAFPSFPSSPAAGAMAPTSGGIGQTGNMVQDNMSLYPGVPDPNSPQGQTGTSYPATSAGSPFMGMAESPTDRYSLPIAATMEETMTGRMMFSVGISSESGLLGSIVIDEQNFDWMRWPRSWRDWPNGTAFRGRGQRFRIEAMPGTEVQRYSVSFEEPYLFNTPISWGVSGVYYERYYDEWYENRLGGQTSLGYRFHQDLVGYLQFRAYSIDLYNPIYPTPRDLADALGTSGLYGFSAKLVYDKRDSPVMASEGWYMSAEMEQVIGTYVYPRASVSLKKYFTLYQRPDGSGRHVLSLRGSFDWSGDDTPIYEHYFTGGYSTIRGFKYRDATVRDNGITVGGHTMILAGVEYLFPITADDMLKGVVFCDTGTSEKSLKNWDDTYRVSVGAGLRISIPWMGSAPIALDFAVPLSKDSEDRTEVFSFTMGGQF